MEEKILSAVGLTTMAGAGGLMGYLYAGLFAWSVPIGVAVGAVGGVGYVMGWGEGG